VDDPQSLAQKLGGPRAIKRFAEIYIAVLILASAAWMGHLAYRGAKEAVHPPSSTDPAVASQMRTAVDGQKASVEKVSEGLTHPLVS